MIRIEQYSNQYKNDVLPFILNIQQNEFNVAVTAEDQPDLNNIENHYIKSGGNFWLAIDNGKLVGTIAIINVGNGIAVLRKMFAVPEYRGEPHRLGQKLFDIALNWTQMQGFQNIYLGTVEKLHAAHRFYKRNGFQQFPEANLPTEINRIKMKADTHYYCLPLNQLEKTA